MSRTHSRFHSYGKHLRRDERQNREPVHISGPMTQGWRQYLPDVPVPESLRTAADGALGHDDGEPPGMKTNHPATDQHDQPISAQENDLHAATTMACHAY